MTSTAAGQAPAPISTGRPVAREEERKHEFVNSGRNSEEPHGWTAKTANIGAAIRQIPYSTFIFYMLRFKNQVTFCSVFPSEAMLWVKEVEMVDSVDDFKSSRILRCWTRRLPLL